MKIAIDGPAGSGKSTVSKLVAERIGFLYIDTGAMYRAVTWLAKTKNLSLEDESVCRRVLAQYPISLKKQANSYQVYVGEQEVTEEIRDPQITEDVPRIAGIPVVREEMLRLQRELAAEQNVVMDGRDIGTRVLPDAEVKIFLIASIEERAKRRREELTAKGYTIDFQQLKEELSSRDRQDSERTISPLKMAEDAELIDTTDMQVDDVVERIIAIYRRKAGEAT